MPGKKHRRTVSCSPAEYHLLEQVARATGHVHKVGRNAGDPNASGCFSAMVLARAKELGIRPPTDEEVEAIKKRERRVKRQRVEEIAGVHFTW